MNAPIMSYAVHCYFKIKIGIGFVNGIDWEKELMSFGDKKNNLDLWLFCQIS